MAQLLRHGLFPRLAGRGRAVASEMRFRRSASAATRSLPELAEENDRTNLAHGLNWFSGLLNPDFASRLAFRDDRQMLTYGDIASAAYTNHLKLEEDFRVEKTIKSTKKTLHGKRIGIFTSHDVSFVISLWSTWLSGGIAVPLGISHPEPQLEYFLKNSDTSVILCSTDTQEKAAKIAKACGAEILPVVPTVSADSNAGALREKILPLAPEADDKALILYTSGTTGQPKGVLWKHGALAGQVESMVDSWAWSPQDTLLHVLPLYHLHGLINCLLTPLACGAAVWMDKEFQAAEVWRKLLSKDKQRVSVFMAVPTIYVKLLDYYHANRQQMPSPEEVHRICLAKMRLMVSGSAPLPNTVFRAWKDLTGHELLERCGMTETGMILGNPLNGPRIPGTVGVPFPKVTARLVPTPAEKPVEVPPAPPAASKSFLGLKTKPKEPSKEAAALPVAEATEPSVPTGELQVTGPNMFTAYWNNEKATRESFSEDGWFRTGDTAELRDGVYRLLGRTSSEIIKSGGYKISALSVERRVHEHPDVAECAVFGVPDETWGEKIVCLIKPKPSATALTAGRDEKELTKVVGKFVAEALPPYTAPREVRLVEELPRNAMGKISKKELSKGYVKAQQAKTEAPVIDKILEKLKVPE
ncbi:Acyl-CoA synthetase family member 3, mitochondrial [Hypsibius exemplaris]|uniref:Acyl-CoA synthetase family member 3, mitochondrial n=1 Tax=Hypsibius exemplaris TaxID=2072580 RepID=A0A9X6RNP0_HYPEX|nr:Acyl-CoA synthetase family member 3, mitochondrial [Hypsibius exemplaris]